MKAAGDLILRLFEIHIYWVFQIC